MDLSNISNIYKENLENFFKNEKIIEIIYKEQYGEKNYNNNKEKYQKDFREIMNNTVFIPYITIDHFEDFIASTRQQFGDEYIEQNYNKELSLLKKLQNEKKNIIKNYSSFLLDDLKHFYPKLTQNEYNEILKKCSNVSFDNNATFIQNLLPKNKKGLFHKSKKAKIEKCINKYKKLTEDKVLIETSSYFKHTLDTPNGKYYTSIMDMMSKGGQWVIQKIGKDSNKNIRYIFLPVLTYKNEEEYLKNAVHEVMHISKEKFYKNKYVSGLLERAIPKNPNKSVLNKNDNFFTNIVQSIKWLKFSKKNNLPQDKELYNTISRKYFY